MGESSNDSQTQRNLIDINVASVEELSTLVGVGRSRAEAIVETRNVSILNNSLFLFICLFYLTEVLFTCSLLVGLHQLKI